MSRKLDVIKCQDKEWIHILTKFILFLNETSGPMQILNYNVDQTFFKKDI